MGLLDSLKGLFGQAKDQAAGVAGSAAAAAAPIAEKASGVAEQAKAAEAFNKEIFALQKNFTDLGRYMAGDFITAINGDTIRLQPAGGKPLNVKIPSGVSDGQKIKLKGKGEPSPDGGAAGDLLLTISVRRHPVFDREGLNLRVDVPVTFVEAALGATIEVPTLGGEPVKLRVAPGTPSGRILRVKGRGVTTPAGTGDLLAEVQVAVPARLTEAALAHLQAFAQAMPAENPRAELLEKARQP